MCTPDEPCPDDMRPAPLGLLTFDYASAEREGWTIAQTEPRVDGTPSVLITRLDQPGQPGPFRTNDEARRHVGLLAEQGSPLHVEAVSLLDRYERFLVQSLAGKPLTRRPAS